MTQPAVPGSANWQRQWTIDAGDVLLRPVTRRIAEDVLAGGPITRTFETGALHTGSLKPWASQSVTSTPARPLC